MPFDFSQRAAIAAKTRIIWNAENTSKTNALYKLLLKSTIYSSFKALLLIQDYCSCNHYFIVVVLTHHFSVSADVRDGKDREGRVEL